MKLVERDPEQIRIKPYSKQKAVREILDQFSQSGMKCAEITNWGEISDTLNDFRSLVKNQISYRNGSKYKNIKIVTRTNDGYRVYLLKKEERYNG